MIVVFGRKRSTDCNPTDYFLPIVDHNIAAKVTFWPQCRDTKPSMMIIGLQNNVTMYYTQK